MENLKDARKVKAGDVKIGDKLRFLTIPYGTKNPLKWVVKIVTNVTLSKSGKRVFIEIDGENHYNGAIGLKTLLNSGSQKKWWDEIEKELGIE